MNAFKNVLLVCLLLVVFSACQKEDEKPASLLKSGLKSDSLSAAININDPGTFLATKGILKITIEDSTYTFDAAVDSVAFVNVALDSSKYFGITAINKAHTISFGISSAGTAKADTTSAIAGGQLLLHHDEADPVQYTLSRYISTRDVGKLSLIKFQQDSTLTKGTFYTILSRQGKSQAYYKTTGTFDLLLK